MNDAPLLEEPAYGDVGWKRDDTCTTGKLLLFDATVCALAALLAHRI